MISNQAQCCEFVQYIIPQALEMSDTSPEYLFTGKECNSCNNGPHFSDLARKRYKSLHTLTTRINRAARENRIPAVMAGIVKHVMEAEIIDQKSEI